MWRGTRNALLRVGLMESTIPGGISLIMRTLTLPTPHEDKQKQLKASRLHIAHTCSMRMLVYTLVNKAYVSLLI